MTVRYRAATGAAWTDASSAAARKPVAQLRTDTAGPGTLSAANLAPTLPASTTLNITREWLDMWGGPRAARFTLTNAGKTALELSGLG